MNSFLIIQTAFLGDVILATSVAEKIHQKFPSSIIDFLVRKGNEGLFPEHPFLREVIVLDKKKRKLRNLLMATLLVRKKKYDCIVNINRFASSGIITFFSGAKEKIGFDKNPFSFCFNKKIKHKIEKNLHETDRNHSLIKNFTDNNPALPRIYPSEADFNSIQIKFDTELKFSSFPYFCLAPASVWFTKQLPKEKWIQLLKKLDNNFPVFLIGGKNDFSFCEDILKSVKQEFGSKKISIFNWAGKFTLLETAALMKNAKMNFVNDSGPLHIASAMNAPVTVVYCSTVPDFGFGPLSDDLKILETKKKLDCRPCGLHGHRACPKGHFECAMTIEFDEIS